MRRSWLIIAMLFLLGATTPDATVLDQANPPGAHAAAARLAKVMGTQDMMMQSMELMRGQIAAAINKQNPGADGSRAMDEIIMPEIRKRSGEMAELIINIWAAHFNQEELEQLSAFYETPLGQKSLRELPTVMSEARKAGADWGRTAFSEIFKERAGDLRALGIGVTR